MVVKYLLATLSALAKKLTPSSATEHNDEGSAYTFNKGGINYLNVSPALGRFLRRKRRTIDLLPKSIIMAISCLLIFIVPFKTFAATAPTTQASNITFTAVSGTGATISWTRGNGGLRAVFVTATTTGTSTPANNTTYTANTIFGSGTQLGTSGWYCVYANTGTTVTISGLTPGTTYRVLVFEYNTGGGTNNPAYDVATTSLKTFTTLPTLSNLSLSTGATTPAFSTTTTTYTQTVSYATTSVTVTPTLSTGVTGATIKVNGTTVASGSASGAIALNVGINTITTVVTVGGATDTYTVTITRSAPTISYASSSFTYATGYAISSLTPTVTPTPNANGYAISPALPAGLSFDIATGIISGTPSATSAGNNYTVTATYPDGSVATTIINITISNTVTLTITATNITQTYGSVDVSGIAFTYSGWINGDSPTSMIVVPSISTTATSASGAGTYPITVGGAQAPAYYTVVYKQGTFTINKAALIIAATGPAIAVGQSVSNAYYTVNYTVNGLVSGDSVDSVYMSINNPNGNTIGASYTVTPSLAAGTGISNYNITYTSYGGTIGQNYTWTGATDTNWFTTTNWTPNGTPGPSDNAIIPGGTANSPDITASTNINTISFTTGTGNTTLAVDAGVKVLFYNGFTVNKNVNLTVNMASTTSQLTVGTTSSRALLDNLGTTTFNSGVVYITYGLNYIYNEASGTVTFQNGNTLDIDGTSGQLAMENSGFMYIGTSNSACTLNIVHSQSVNNQASGNFYLGSTSSINFLDNAAHDSHFSNNLGGNFTIQSDQYGTGSIGKIPNNPGTHQNSFDGLFTCERYISPYRGYRTVASPVYAATVGQNNVYSLNYVKNTSYISGTSATGGFDKVSQGPTLYLFREDMTYSNATFISGNFQSINSLTSGNNATPTYTFDVTAGSYSIPVSNGFLFFYRGYRYSSTYTKAQQFTAGNPAEASTLSTTGYLNQQQVVFRAWYTPTSNLLGYSNSNVAALGFNLVANPYACAIDWNTQQNSSTTTGIYALNLSPYIYEFNARTGNYDTYNGVTHVGTNNGTRTVMSGQAFFVLALNSSAQLIFNESAKSTTLQTTGVNLLMGKPADLLARTQSLRLQMSLDTINKDDTFISFDPNAKTTLDYTEDAPYRAGSGKVSISSMSSDNQSLAVNVLPFNNQGQTIPVKIGATATGAYTLNMTEINSIPKFFDVLLADNETKDTTDMRNGPYNFNVSLTDTNSYGAHRFAVIMRQNPAYAYQLLNFNAQKVPNVREVQVVWDTKNEENYTNFTVERSIDGGQTFAVLGGVPATGAGNYGFTDKSPIVGMNLYRLKQEDINSKITYSPIVPIGYANTVNGFAQNSVNIYPNPAAGRINLAIATPSAVPSNSYNILITNSSGNMLKKVTSNQPYWQGDATGWMPGTYMVKVFDAKTQSLIGTTKFIKL
ncbi:MAG TPA: MBG domain-containing protein [Mucilaginibacter sp.]